MVIHQTLRTPASGRYYLGTSEDVSLVIKRRQRDNHIFTALRIPINSSHLREDLAALSEDDFDQVYKIVRQVAKNRSMI